MTFPLKWRGNLITIINSYGLWEREGAYSGYRHVPKQTFLRMCHECDFSDTEALDAYRLYNCWRYQDGWEVKES